VPSAIAADDWKPCWLWISGSSPAWNAQRCAGEFAPGSSRARFRPRRPGELRRACEPVRFAPELDQLERYVPDERRLEIGRVCDELVCHGVRLVSLAREDVQR